MGNGIGLVGAVALILHEYVIINNCRPWVVLLFVERLVSVSVLLNRWGINDYSKKAAGINSLII